MVGGKEIDTTKVDSTKSIDEYDGETQGAIRKLMWEQEQKAMGKKTTEETRQEDLLRQAWDALDLRSPVNHSTLRRSTGADRRRGHWTQPS